MWFDMTCADRLHTGEMLDIPQHLMQRLQAVRSEEELRELLNEHPELLPVLPYLATQAQVSQGPPVSRPLPNELFALLQELESPPRLSDTLHRIQVCQAALVLVDRAQQPELWAVLQGGVGHMTVDTCGKPDLPTLHAALKAQRMSAEVPRSSKESWCPTMAIRLA